jgi:hypothetical protein
VVPAYFIHLLGYCDLLRCWLRADHSAFLTQKGCKINGWDRHFREVLLNTSSKCYYSLGVLTVNSQNVFFLRGSISLTVKSKVLLPSRKSEAGKSETEADMIVHHVSQNTYLAQEKKAQHDSS